MTLLYVSSSEFPSYSANSIQVMRMCDAFAQKFNSIHLLGKAFKADHKSIKEYYGLSHNFVYHECRWPPHRMGGIIYGLGVSRTLKQHALAPNLVYGRSPYGMLAAAGLGCPLIYEVHAPPENTGRWSIERLLIAQKSLKRIVFISRHLRDKYELLYGRALKRIDLLVSHDAADDPLRDDSTIELNPLELGPGFHIGYVGSLHKGKGADLVIEIAQRMPDLSFHLVGGTPEQVQSTIRKGVTSNLKLHGHIAPAKAAVAARQFSIVLLPAARHVCGMGDRGNIAQWMSPLKLFEYMASGVATIASNLNVLQEVLTDQTNAILASPDDVDSWVQAIRRLADNETLRTQIASAARARFLAQHTWQHRANAVLEGIPC